MSTLKYTVMQMLKKEFPNLLITDTPINNETKTKEYKFPKVLFKEYKDSECKLIQVIDYETYDKYLKEEVPDFLGKNIYGYNLCLDNNIKSKILNYDDNIGVFELETPIKNLYEYNDMLYILDNYTDVEESTDDFIFVYSTYSYAKTLNANTVENYVRINMDVFIYDDPNNDKVFEYNERIRKLFNRDFQLLDKDNKKLKKTAYIYNQSTFDMSEYNVSNKIVRSSMLIKTIEKE